MNQYRMPPRMPPIVEAVTAEEFERAQLEAEMVFCRRCGVMENVAVSMEAYGTVVLDQEHVPGAEDATGIYHLYICPRCGHKAMSQQHGEEDGETIEDKARADYLQEVDPIYE